MNRSSRMLSRHDGLRGEHKMRRLPPGSVRVPSAMILALAAVTPDDSRLRRNNHPPCKESRRDCSVVIAAVLRTLALG
jgi:hypothetical protein